MQNSKFKNRLLTTVDYLRKAPIVRGLPMEISVEPTNNCDLKCIFCPRSKMKREKGNMDFSLFKKIIDEVSGYAELIEFGMYGEHLWYPHIIEAIKHCRHKPGRLH